MESCFVLWSGGLDSTYLILSLLRKGYKVHAGYVFVEGNVRKSHMERVAIHNMLPKINKHFPPGNKTPALKYHGIIFKGKRTTNTKNMRFPQVGYFMQALLGAPITDYRALGYVAGDGILSKLEDVKKLYESYNPFSFDPMPKLLCPLAEMKKTEIYSDMEANFPNVLKYCVNCEQPTVDYKPCGGCRSCKRKVRELSL